MSLQFTLSWDNTAVLANVNAIAQRALYRKRSVGGSFISIGFNPTNDLPTSATTVFSPGGLLSNAVYQFKLQTICTLNGPSDNNNGVQEQIKFACIDAEASAADNNSILVFIPATEDIDGVLFSLYNAADSVQIYPEVAAVSGISGFTHLFTGLTPGTTYTIRSVLQATINGTQIRSDIGSQIGSYCSIQLATTSPVAANLKFEWTRSLSETVNLTGKINGVFSYIDWGDGIINNLLTHTYTSTGDFKVEVGGSTATTINLSSMALIHLTAIPNTLVNLNCSSNTIDEYHNFTNTNLAIVNINNNKVTNSPVLNFSGTPNITSLLFSNNLLVGTVDVSPLLSLDKLDLSNNAITATSDLDINSILTVLKMSNNSLSGSPSFNLPGLITLDISSNSYNGTIDIALSVSLKYLNLSSNTFIFVDLPWPLLSSTAPSPIYVNLSNNTIPVTGTGGINYLLAGLDSSGGTNGTLITVGQTPSAPPSGAGITARFNLIGKTWTVTTD